MKSKRLKDAKRARTKAAKRERLNPSRSTSLRFPIIMPFLFLSFACAATRIGGVSSPQQIAQPKRAPSVNQDDYAANFASSAAIERAARAQQPEEVLSPAHTTAQSLATVALSYSGANEPKTVNYPGGTSARDELSSPSRYYSVSTGRFTSMDPASPTQMNPLSCKILCWAEFQPDGKC